MEMDKLKPSTSMKIQYAKLALDAFPELASVDENCPFVSFIVTFFVPLVLCFHC